MDVDAIEAKAKADEAAKRPRKSWRRPAAASPLPAK
jgi:hypothetical protein